MTVTKELEELILQMKRHDAEIAKVVNEFQVFLSQENLLSVEQVSRIYSLMHVMDEKGVLNRNLMDEVDTKRKKDISRIKPYVEGIETYIRNVKKGGNLSSPTTLQKQINQLETSQALARSWEDSRLGNRIDKLLRSPQLSIEYEHPEPFSVPPWVKGTLGLMSIAAFIGVISYMGVNEKPVRTVSRAPITSTKPKVPETIKPVVPETVKPRVPATVKPEPLEKKVGYLTIYPNPKDATVKVMDIGPRYRQGIELVVGSHHIRVEKSGYLTKNEHIYIPKGDHVRKSIALKRYVPPKPKVPKKKYLPSWVTKVAFNSSWEEREVVERYLANPQGWDVRTYTNTWITIQQLKPRKYYNIHQKEPKPLEVFHNGKLVKSYGFSSAHIAASPNQDKIFIMEQTRESYEYFAGKFWVGDYKRRKRNHQYEGHLKVLYPNGTTKHVSYNVCGHIKVRWVDNNTINIDTGTCGSQWYEKKGNVSVR